MSALVAALNDPDTNVRFHAIEALGKLGAGEAVEPLVAIAESRDFFLAFAALEALVKINDASIGPRLTPLLADAPLAGQAAEALGQIGDEFSVAPLVQALDLELAPADAIADAIARIHQRHKDLFGDGGAIEDIVRRTITPAGAERILQALPRGSGTRLRGLVVVLGWMEGDAVRRALAHLLGTSGVHRDVIEALVRFGSPAVDVLVEQLSREDIDTRRAAVIALGRIADRRAVPALVALLDEPDDRDLWVAVAGALARIGDGRAFEPLLALIGDDDAGVRHAAIGALNSIGHPAMASRIRALLADSNPHVRESAVRVAGYFGYDACVDDVVARCRDEDETVRPRRSSICRFSTIRARSTPCGTRWPPTRRGHGRAAAHAPRRARRTRSAAAAPLLEQAVADADAGPLLRRDQHRRRGDGALPPVLEQLAKTDTARHVRVAAVEALGAVGGERALAILAPFAAAAKPISRTRRCARSGGFGPPRSSAGGDPRRRIRGGGRLPPKRRRDGTRRRGGCLADGRGGRRSDVVRAAMSALAMLAGCAAPVGRRAVEALATATAESSRHEDGVRSRASRSARCHGLRAASAPTTPTCGARLSMRSAGWRTRWRPSAYRRGRWTTAHAVGGGARSRPCRVLGTRGMRAGSP